ncbi:HutD family protein [Acinetobacter sp. ANC 4910]|uniref:HutD/Ves family protein n=1 Tax=Acinetobacter sp. ANC 4910 TaxID=2529850 RepID=UPI00103FD38F|nr:HutD family protein [Acinetobacter sp. ANC 4910]TCB30228.1 HutD family protein [Acinetobacter sp. ANC 4910]
MIELLTANHYKKMPWKNGAGYTLELARSAGEELTEFDWRISMADVTTSGTFSQFMGMQRFLTVLEGTGIALNIDGATHTLQTLQSIQFSGDRLVSCNLLAGPIRDFNLIYSPLHYTARYQWIEDSSALEFFSSADVIFIFNQSILALELSVDGQRFKLEQHQSIYIHSNQNVKHFIFPASAVRQGCWIELSKI